MKNKKLLIGILAAIVVLGIVGGLIAFLGGNNNQNVDPTTVTTEPDATVSEADIEGITSALEYLKTVYPVGEEPTQTPRSFERPGVVRIGGVPYTVVWTVDAAEDIVKVVPGEGDIVTFEVNKALAEDAPYKLTATITDAVGNVVTFTWDMVVPKAVDQVAIVKEAYELADGESMNREVVLSGVITAINTPYSSDFANISVIMVVEGGEDYPILCYRLKGEGVDDLDVGDTITVSGIIKNYKGTIEFDAGCMLLEYENTGEEFILPETVEEILKLAYSLKVGEALPVNVTLTGEISQVNTPYDAGYDNVSVTIVVDGFGQYPILCYRLKGDGASQIGKGDTITVTGVLKNYNGKIEFDSGCKLDSWEDTGTDVPMDNKHTAQLVKNPETGTAYKLFVKQGNLNTVLYFNGQMNGYYLGTTKNPNEAADVYIQSYEGGYRMYCLSYGVRYYITLVSSYNATQGKTYINPDLSTWSNRVWYYDSEFNTMYTSLDGNDYYLGCYNSFDTMGSSKTSYLGGDSNFPAHFGILVDKDKVVEEEEQDFSAYYKTEIVDAPETGKPYKFGLTQMAIDGQPIIYFNGKLSNQFYLGGTKDPAHAVDITLVDAEGGYYITFKDASGAVQYIVMYQNVDDAGELRTNVGISSEPDTVFQYNDQLKTLVAMMPDGQYYYIGTYKTYTTFSASNVSYIEGGSNTSFQGHMMTVTEITGAATAEEAAVQIKKVYINGYKDDYSLVSKFKVRDDEFDVAWSVETTNKKAVSIKNGKLVMVPQEKPVNFRLTATITKGEDSATAVWELVVPQLAADNVETLKTDVPYALGLTQKLLSGAPTLYFNGSTDSSNYRLSTTQKAASVVAVYVEKAGKDGYRLYFMDGDTKTYIRVYEYQKADGNMGGSIELTTQKPEEYFTFDKDLATLIYTNGGNSYFLGTYSTYTTISVSSTYYITGDKADTVDNTQFIARFYPMPEVNGEEEEEKPDVQLGYVTKAEVGKAYKFGMVQGGLDNALLLFNGTMQGFYGATTESVSEAVDVYLENADGGYYLSFTDPYGAKQYISVQQNDTHTNFVITADAQTVFTFDETHYTLTTELNGEVYYIGTYNSFSTLSVSKYSYVTSASSYPARLYAEGEGTVKPEEPKPTDPTEPTEPTKPTAPSVSVGLDDGDKVVIFAPAYNKALSALKVNETSYYNKGVDITVKKNKVTGYADTEVWTVIANADGSYSFSNGGKNIALADSFSSMNLGEVHDDWFVISLGDGLYNIQNVARGNYMEWYASKDNWSTYNSSYAATDDQFQMSFYVIGEGIISDEAAPTDPTTKPSTNPTESKPTESTTPTEPTTPPETAPVGYELTMVTSVKAGETYKLGFQQGGLGNAMYYFSGEMQGYYGATTQEWDSAVDVTLEKVKGGYNLAFTNASGAKQYINVVQSGTYTNFTIADSASTVYTFDKEHNTLTTVIGEETYYMGTYRTFTTFSVSKSSYLESDTSYASHLYVMKEVDPSTTTKPVPTEPTTKPATEPTTKPTTKPSTEPTTKPGTEPTVPTTPGAVELNNGDQIVIFAPAYNKALSALKVTETSYYNKGVDIVINGNAITGFTADETWTVIANADGSYSFSNNGKNIGLGDSFSSLNLGEIHDDWNLIDLGDGLYNIQNTGRGNYMEWYASKDNWSTYNSDRAATDDQFQLSIFIIGEGILGGETEPTEPTDPTTEPTTEPSTDPSVPPVTDPTTPSEEGYVKVESAADFVSGQYVMIVGSGYAPGVLDGAWLSAVQPTVDGNKVTDPAGGVWTLTVNGDKVIITDANGVSIAPKAAKTNGIIEGSYEWTWSFANGVFTFDAVAEEVRLASNASDGQYGGFNRFRAYKLTTLANTQYGSDYYSEFTLYKLSGNGSVEPTDPTNPTTEPTTEPATEPDTTEPTVPTTPSTGDGYVKVENAADFVSGQYVMVVGSGYAPGVLDGTWVSAVQPTVDGNKVTDPAGGVWTLTVSGDKVTITDANGISIAPKAANTNGIISGDYEWTWSFADGVFTFDATAEGVRLASNSTANSGDNKFRAYKLTTLANTQYGSAYFSEFTLYKLGGSGTVDPTDPIVTDPTTEPTTEPTTQPSIEPELPYVATVSELEVGVAYKLGLAQNANGKTLYFNGQTESASVTYRLAMTENKDDAVDVYLEAVNGGYALYFYNGNTKTYIRVYHRTDGDPGYGKGSLEFVTAAPNETFVFDEAAATLVYDYDGNNAYYMGTYGTFVTISVSNTSYITGNKAGDVDVKQFPARLYKTGESTEPSEPATTEATEPATEPTTPSTPSEEGYVQVENAADFVSGSYVMVVGSGYAPGVLDGTWVSAVQPVVDGNKVTDPAGGVWTLTVNGDKVTITDANGISIAPKAANTNGIISGSYEWTWSFADGVFTFDATAEGVRLASNSTANSGDNKFRAYKLTTLANTQYGSAYFSTFTLYKLGEGTPDVSEPTTSAPVVTEPATTEPTTQPSVEPELPYVATVSELEVGVAYKLGLAQNANGKTLYFNGQTESASVTYRLAMTENKDNAVDVYLEAVNGGYALYFYNGSTKTYIRVYHRTDGNPGYGKGSLEFVTDVPNETFVFDEAAATLVYDYDGNNAYYMGTYSTFTTISVSNTSYITGNKAGDVDVKQFPARLYKTGSSTEPTEPEATEPAVTEPEVTYNLVAGKDLTIELETIENLKTISFDYKVSDGTFNLALSMADRNKYYGYFAFDKYGMVDRYDGVTVETLDDDFIRVTCDVAALTKMTGTPNAGFSIFYIRGMWSDANGVIKNIVMSGEAEEEPTAPAQSKYMKVTSAEDFTSGTYVMVVGSGYAPGVLDGTWVSAVKPTVDGNNVTDAAGGVWTLTVNGDKVTITDANGISIAPKATNTNGIISGSYEWTWSFADGVFTFDATAESVRLASNSTANSGDNKFRAYKLTTLANTQYGSAYFSEFTLFKLV